MSSSNPVEFIVPPETDFKRIDIICAEHFPGISRSRIQAALEKGEVIVNGAVAKKNLKVKTGDVVAIADEKFNEVVQSLPMAENIPLDVIFEDEYFAVVNKPAGMVVHPGNGNLTGTLVNALLARSGGLSDGSTPERPGIVHRLDKDTSGLLIVAKSNSAHSALSALFSNRQIEKYYLGIVICGVPLEHETIDAAIGRASTNPTVRVIRKDGKPAITEYWTLQKQGAVSLLKFSLHTGRTHQIRVHCRYKGFSILADSVYGGAKTSLMRVEPLQRPFAAKMYDCFDRQALHAWNVRFVHPFTNEPVDLTAPLPADFAAGIKLFNPPVVLE